MARCPDEGRGGKPPLAAAAMRRGQRLVDRPPGDRDLRWHVEAAFLGDLPAVAATCLRETEAARPSGRL